MFCSRADSRSACLIGDGEIDLGQHEMVDEVLGADTTACAALYVVSTYMLSLPAERATAVKDAGRYDEALALASILARKRQLLVFDRFLARQSELCRRSSSSPSTTASSSST